MACCGHVEMNISDRNWRRNYQIFSFFNIPPLQIRFYLLALFTLHLFLSLLIYLCEWMHLYICMHVFVCICVYTNDAYCIFSSHCSIFSYSFRQKGRHTVNTKLAPDHARESTKVYTRMASSNHTNSSFSCSLFIGLDRQQDPETLLFLVSQNL